MKKETERQTKSFYRLWNDGLDYIFEWSNHYVLVDVEQHAKTLYSICEQLRTLAPNRFELEVAIEELINRAYLLGFPWPKEIPNWFPMSTEELALRPIKYASIKVREWTAKKAFSLAREYDLPLSFLLDRLFYLIEENPMLESSVRTKFTRYCPCCPIQNRGFQGTGPGVE